MNIMNGTNGHHENGNGELNGVGFSSKGVWTIGLINAQFKYLTAETFGFKINANGASLKKKQVWILEPANGGDTLSVYLRSHLGKYLAVDSFGNVTCEADEKEPGSLFQIHVSDEGKWAFKNKTRGYFLGASSDKLICTAKIPANPEYWLAHLAARPQVNLRSVGRKRFAHLSENLDEIHVDANIPWGEDTLFTLEFRAEDSGKYAVHTCNNKYLSREGKLVDTCNANCLFSLEYHAGQIALRDNSGAYLSPIGSKAILKTRSNTVTKDELFTLEDSLPQASFIAALNSKYVSVKQGQIALRDNSGAYLSPIGSKAILKTRSNTVTKDELFTLEDSLPQASFIAALNSKYVSVKQDLSSKLGLIKLSFHGSVYGIKLVSADMKYVQIFAVRNTQYYISKLADGFTDAVHKKLQSIALERYLHWIILV
ncbi:protein singed-like [Diaphorina citri]|uniref:Protein singed-like n=1 Tax=Diaphorina citri TaxID=121845 RepID=A0A3Q0IPZ1_DIACI|nr:protein singed-like [Diaphorina citri]